MKPQTIQLQCWLVLLSLAASLQITLGYYDPAAQRWINRDPISDQGRLGFWPPEVRSAARSFPARWARPPLPLGVNRQRAAMMDGLTAYALLSNDPMNKLDLHGLLGIGSPGLACMPKDCDGTPGNSDPPDNDARDRCETSGGKYVTFAECFYASWDACVRSEGYGSWPGIIGVGIGAIIGGRICPAKGADIGGVVGGIIGGAAVGSFRCGGMVCCALAGGRLLY